MHEMNLAAAVERAVKAGAVFISVCLQPPSQTAEANSHPCAS